MVLSHLLSEDFIKFKGSIQHRFLYVLADPSENVRGFVEAVTDELLPNAAEGAGTLFFRDQGIVGAALSVRNVQILKTLSKTTQNTDHIVKYFQKALKASTSRTSVRPCSSPAGLRAHPAAPHRHAALVLRGRDRRAQRLDRAPALPGRRPRGERLQLPAREQAQTQQLYHFGWAIWLYQRI